ncbi:MAG TPA: Zn-dependent hydrolase [Ramlibacter sp.]|nr:Zn-dependent hydrolase [Ramlibacter sp.]
MFDAAVRRAALASADLFARLRAPWPTGGVERDTFGAGEQHAHDLLIAEARAMDLQTRTDFAGNLWITLPGRDRGAPAWVTGSHLDSVPQGGNFDGAAGVVAGVAVIKAMRASGVQPPRDIVLAAFRAEEASSWYQGDFGSHVGSRAALGMCDPQELQRARHVRDGRTLFERMQAAGARPQEIRPGHRSIDPARCHGFLELHIEQGPVLVERGLPVGVVTGIRGSARARNAGIRGEDAHSGAVPHEYRHDAVLAGAEFCHRMDQAWAQVRAEGGDLVFTVGKFATDAARHSITKVPGRVDFSIDLRSQDAATLHRMQELAGQLACEIGAARGVQVELGAFNLSHPAVMDPVLVDSLDSGCRELGIAAMRLPSGAGHDAADFATAGVPTAMLFVRNDRGSHNADEAMDLEDFAQGTRVLAWQLMR